MAISEAYLDPSGSGSKGVGSVGVYNSTADALATILENGYFDAYATSFKDGQFLAVKGTDGFGLYGVSVSGTTDVALKASGAGFKLETIASTGSTGTSLNADGMSLFTSTYAGTYALPVPEPGQGEKTLVMGTTSAIVVASTVDIDIAGNTTMTFSAKDQIAILVPINSSKWQLVQNGTAAGSTLGTAVGAALS